MRGVKMADKTGVALAALRISIGFVFLWAFFDKLIGLGFATCRDKASGTINILCEKAWLSGGSPTLGFLSNSVTGPLKGFYNSIAGNVFVDWIFMIGLLGIGIGLIFGIAMKLTTYSGATLLFLMWTAQILPSNNPIIDDHIVYAIALLVLHYWNGGTYFGLHDKWKSLRIVQKNKWLE
jgi:thiosulfate dehydrogenase (quinone) large subunit